MLLGTAQTVTAAKTFNAGALKIASGGDIVDANSNELLKFTATASAVNELTIANGATGVSAKVTCSGETNTGVIFETKGSGRHKILSPASNNSYSVIDTTTSTQNAGVLLQLAATTKAEIAAVGSANAVVTGSAANDLVFKTQGGSFLWSNDGATDKIAMRLAHTTGTLTVYGPTASDGRLDIDTITAGRTARMAIRQAGTLFSQIGAAGVDNGLSTGSSAGDTVIVTQTKNFDVSTDGGSALAFQVVTNNGGIKTSAPSGGTAAAWKLGTVASVSPTSPNRTIELDVGGTRYFLAAKTTND
jgi:hypothetical protein